MGVKGARAGVDAMGRPYVAGGRGGIYFRGRIPTGRPDPVQQEPPRGRSPAPVVWIFAAVLTIIGLLLFLAR